MRPHSYRHELRTLFCFILLIPALSFGAPYQIFLLRHADKLQQKETGPALSAKGYVRALKFTYYFLNNYGEPDFIIAGNPKNKDSSIRELQTVAPLVNILAERHPTTGFNILHPYSHDEQDQLARYVLTDKKFDNKIVLICWRHTKIVELAKALGIKEKLMPWPDDDYDSVFIINYDHLGNVSRFIVLHQQYPLKTKISWVELYNQLITM